MKLSCPLALALLSSTSSTRAFAPQQLKQKQLQAALFNRLRVRSTRFSSGTAMAEGSDGTTASTLRVGLCQFRVTESKETNHKTCKEFIARATDKGSQLVVLPEIWASPYATTAFPEYAEELPSVGEINTERSQSAKVLQEASVKHKVWIVGGSIAEQHEGNIYNTCLVFSPTGEVVAKHRKVHLFDIDVPGGITFKESDVSTKNYGSISPNASSHTCAAQDS